MVTVTFDLMTSKWHHICCGEVVAYPTACNFLPPSILALQAGGVQHGRTRETNGHTAGEERVIWSLFR